MPTLALLIIIQQPYYEKITFYRIVIAMVGNNSTN